MNMRSTVFKPATLKLERDLTPEKVDLEKSQSSASGTHSKGPDLGRAEVHDGNHLPTVLININNKNRKLKENLHIHHAVSKGARTPGPAGQNKTQGACLGQEENWMSLEALTAPSKPVGTDSNLIKNKPLFMSGQTDSMSKTASPVNTNRNTRELASESTDRNAGAVGGPLSVVALEVNLEGKWQNLKKNTSHSPTQANCLRQILLLQLDLIEQQQQQLQAKDKEIEELKNEKETLLARIERMERRVQLVKKDTSKEKQKNILAECEEHEALPEPENSEREDIADEEADCRPLDSLRALHFSRVEKGHKRKFSFWSPKTPMKKLSGEFSKARRKTPKLTLNNNDMEAGHSLTQRELRSKEAIEKVGDLQGDSSPSKGFFLSLQPKAEPLSSSFEMEDLPYMSTKEMYLCRWHQPPPFPLRETSPKKEETVAIPSWREHFMEPLEEATDVVENLDDGVFLKRHAKLELDEKRRKRWDIQRIREQRMFQRLQQRMYKKKGIQESEPGLSSFYPDADDVESLMITPFLPVVAFGRPLPKLAQQNFELPWLDERSRCRIEMQKKQTPHRTCRK
ncbi:male-specific lethal 1 homolog isoform X1 [Erpetoichthys calabaricus]|uniref:MSL complex subunit 1a n=1 Tax=Erpetoichthys calabaricus TaxID=27687 RepID=A0A8C4TNR7_ERPCA|nr:male-specific lethal 1 homolog isoform X1 [Erpetoichthys calabaricus]